VISKDISLRGLEVFEVIARTGSVARTAEEMQMSLPAVSQQLRNLEDSVGQPLMDHGRRPMQLTAAGRMFRKRTEEVLRQLRQAMAEANVLELGHLVQLRLGVIDDFDTHVTPELTAVLAGALKDCEFRLHTRPSHELCEMAAARRLDVAVAASPDGGIAGLTEYPLLADPFILIVPRGFAFDPADPGAALSDLPFLRYGREQMIGRQIELQLHRRRLTFANRFELDSNPAIHALVGHGSGWAVTTVLSYLRSQRFHDRIDAHPLPFAAFVRTISLFSPLDWIPNAAAELAQTFRGLLRSGVVAPARERFPWLGGQLAVLDDSG
jgi:DNA-binding transcriptional LysR family regulator